LFNYSLVFALLGVFATIYQISDDYKKRNFKFQIEMYDIFLLFIFLFMIIFIGFHNDLNYHWEIENYQLSSRLLAELCLLGFSTYLVYRYFILLNSKVINNIKKYNETFNQYINLQKYDNIINDLDVYRNQLLGDDYTVIKSNLENLIKNDFFVERLVNTNAYLSIIILNKDIEWESLDGFIHLLFPKLLDKQGSMIYYETKIIDYNVKVKYETYKIEDKVLYNSIFDSLENLKKFQRLAHVFGEYAIDRLKERHSIENDPGNKHEEEYDDYSNKKWRDPIFISIHFFDIMIRQGIYFGIHDFLDLNYYHFFLSIILKNIKYDDNYDDVEAATFYEFYLDTIFNNYCDWIQFAAHDKNLTDNIIIKETLKFLFYGFEKVIRSTILRDSIKRAIFRKILHAIKYLADCNNEINHSITIAKNIIKKIEEVDIISQELWCLLWRDFRGVHINDHNINRSISEIIYNKCNFNREE